MSQYIPSYTPAPKKDYGDYMKIKMKQFRLITFLEKLSFDGAYSVAHITITEINKEIVLRSIQKEQGARSLRYLTVKKEYFDELEPTDVPFKLEVDKIIKVIKNIPSDEEITITRNGQKISVKSNRVDLNLNYQKVDDDEYMKNVPLKMIDGVPHFGKNIDIPLSIKLTMKRDELKDVVSLASSIDTKIYQFLIANKKLNIRIGDIHQLDDYILFDSNVSVKDKTSLNVTFTYGIEAISKTFHQNEFTLYMDTDKPLLIQEKGEHYTLGVFLPPYTKKN